MHAKALFSSLPAIVWTWGALVEAQTFDYVIVGGGTCGLTIASRLSEQANVTVAVIEPGTDQRNNPNVTDPDLYRAAIGTPIDWGYLTVAQPGAANRVLRYAQGKAIGGTSTINGMTYIRGQAAQIDAWQSIGNTGWNWTTMLPYYMRAEKFIPPTAAQVAAGASYQAQYNGASGHVHVSFPYDLQNGTYEPTAQQTWQSLSQPLNKDANSGNVHGFDVWPRTMDRDANLRYDAATSYYWPIANRTNLKLFQGTATKLTWQGSSTVANGVQYVAANGSTVTIGASREVIVSAGALRTPPFLEASGIGNPKILSANGITTRISLPGVGENLQDQPLITLQYSSTANITGLTPYATFPTAEDFFGSNFSAMSASTNASIPQWATTVANANGNYINASALETIFNIQHDLIFNQGVPSAEILTAGHDGSTVSSVWWTLLPFSRGSVHIGSSLNVPAIDPKFLLIDYDLASQTAVGRLCRKFWATQPAKKIVTGNIVPGPSVLPAGATDAQWSSYIKSKFSPNYHPLGSAAMMSQDLGGVVDPTLKVYGTSNVRVVDASVLPMQISGHLTSTLYAVAERAADIIKSS